MNGCATRRVRAIRLQDDRSMTNEPLLAMGASERTANVAEAGEDIILAPGDRIEALVG